MTNNWKEEFNKRFRNFAGGNPIEGSLELTHNNVRDFIEETLASHKKEWVDKTLAMKREVQEGIYCNCDGECCLNGLCPTFFNAALDEVFSLLSKEEDNG